MIPWISAWRRPLAFASILALAACETAPTGSNPLTGGAPEEPEAPADEGAPIGGGDVPPGTASPTPDDSLFRYEPPDGNGNGTAQSISYDAATDTFFVDNLAFDGDNGYSRDDVVGSLGPYAVYENDSTFLDPASGTPILQFQHKALYGVSTNTVGTAPRTQFAIVRTGDYIGYGFGGWVIQREGGVVLPETGQAIYTGPYGAIRDFQNRGGIEYATGTATVAIDFEDFNSGDAVDGRVTGRTIFDEDGTDITQDYLDALEDEYGGTYTALPSLIFTVGPGVMDANGEIRGQLSSSIVNGDGVIEGLEAGNYYAIVAGDDAGEVVGVLVVESPDPRSDGVTVRETGGFILYRP